jgi:two-component sensor histidine kinase
LGLFVFIGVIEKEFLMTPTLMRATAAPNIPEPLQLDLMAEANHRIANNLAMIAGLARLQAATLGDGTGSFTGKEVRLMLQEFGGRVDAVARLHRLLANPGQQATVDLADYLRGIAEAVIATVSFSGHADLRVDCELGCTISSKRALSLGLIVGELVTNAVKYAHPTGIGGQINVGCRRDPDGRILVEVSDDGVGLPDGLDPMTSTGLCLRLVRSLAQQLGAKLAFDDDGLGLRVMLSICPASIA